MRLGRNLARTFLEYYRFINVLPISPSTQISSRRGRPKTHRPRTRSKAKQDIQPRPKTTRANAPISYKDLSKCYDSDSNDNSPVRYNHMSYGFGTRSKGNIYLNQDQFSLLNIQSSQFHNLDFSTEFRPKSREKSPPKMEKGRMDQSATISVPPKPYLTIIDFNLLTRGGLEKAKSKSFDTAQKLPSPIKKKK